MSRETLDRLTAAEWKVMKIVWRRKSCSSRDVYEEARKEHGWAPTTTKTLLRRLVEKSHLSVTPVGTSYLYRPARPAWQSLARAADTLLENTLEGMDGKLLAYMVKKSRLTPDDLAQLRAILDDLASAEGGDDDEEAKP
jgi:BlaI family transcriptional regulator, penicillinase repressor